MKGVHTTDLGLISLTVQTKVSRAWSGAPDFREINLRQGVGGEKIWRKILNYEGKSDIQRMSGNQTKAETHCTSSCYACILTTAYCSGHPV